MSCQFEAGIVYTTSSTPGPHVIASLLHRSGLIERVAKASTILIKPNLVETLPPPITTPVVLVEALIDYLRKHCSARIIIGEGTGSLSYDTWQPFNELGYTAMAAKKKVELVDLNEETSIRQTKEGCQRWPEFYLPEIAQKSFLISVPVLKAHTLAGVTLGMKNMIGLAPPQHYRRGNSWKKSAFHEGIQEAIADLNRYRTPDFTLLDASVGMAEAHLFGPTCKPPVSIYAAAHDPVAIDAYGAGLLKKKWQNVGHIASVHGELGQADPLQIIAV